MGDVLRIATSDRADAICIAEALPSHDARVEFEDPCWVVVVPAVKSGVVLTGVIAAVSACLDELSVAAVTVTIDEQTYIMEGAATPS
jgi:hypothetical protein